MARFLDLIQGRITRVVDDKVTELISVFFIPTDPLIPVFDVPGRGAEAEEGDDALRRMDQIADLAYQHSLACRKPSKIKASRAFRLTPTRDFTPTLPQCAPG